MKENEETMTNVILVAIIWIAIIAIIGVYFISEAEKNDTNYKNYGGGSSYSGGSSSSSYSGGTSSGGSSYNPADYNSKGEYKPVESMTQKEKKEELTQMLRNSIK